MFDPCRRRRRLLVRVVLLLWTGACQPGPATSDSHGGSAGGDQSTDTAADSGGPVDADGDGFDTEQDCDDSDPAIHPAATEICDGRDNDCDGEVDGAAAVDPGIWYADGDGDGHGDSSSAVTACDAPSGHVAKQGDCDDANDQVHPDMEEVCNDGLDNDCDGTANHCELSGDIDLSTAGAAIFGHTFNASVGRAVGGAGDVDGDGIADLMVAARQSVSPGYVYVFQGPISGENLTSSADAILTGEEDGDDFGDTLAAAGDTNGDGFDDVWIGAGSNSAGGYHAGAVYLFQGPLSGSVDADEASAVLVGEAEYQSLGGAFSTGADVTGDSLVDLVIGCPADDTVGSNGGAVYLVSGAVSGTQSISEVSTSIRGQRSGDQFGQSVANVGDTDGDGQPDLVVGAIFHKTEQERRGAAYLFLGPLGASGFAADADAKLVGRTDYSYLGLAVSSAGDDDLDGYADVWVAAPGRPLAPTQPAEVFLFRGPISSMEVDSAEAVLSTGELDNLGRAVAGGIDSNLDGRADLLLGAPVGGLGGEAFLALGPFSGAMTMEDVGVRLAASSPGSEAGEALDWVGDVSGDGVNDFVVGADRDSTWLTDSGAAWLVFGLHL